MVWSLKLRLELVTWFLLDLIQLRSLTIVLTVLNFLVHYKNENYQRIYIMEAKPSLSTPSPTEISVPLQRRKSTVITLQIADKEKKLMVRFLWCQKCWCSWNIDIVKISMLINKRNILSLKVQYWSSKSAKAPDYILMTRSVGNSTLLMIRKLNRRKH